MTCAYLSESVKSTEREGEYTNEQDRRARMKNSGRVMGNSRGSHSSLRSTEALDMREKLNSHKLETRVS